MNATDDREVIDACSGVYDKASIIPRDVIPQTIMISFPQIDFRQFRCLRCLSYENLNDLRKRLIV
jgi:hypothetical protein